MAMKFEDAFNPFRALRHGVESMKRAPAPVLVAGLLLFALQACSGGGNYRMPGGSDSPWHTGSSGMDAAMIGLMVMFAVIGLGCAAVVLAVRSFIEPGTYRVGEAITIDGTTGMDRLFSGKDVWLSVLGYRLLTAAISLGVTAVCALPGGLLLALAYVKGQHGGDPPVPLLVLGGLLIAALVVPVMLYVWLGLQLGTVAIALERLGTMAALDRSWTAARGNRLRLLWYDIVNMGLSMVGVMLCCVGLIPVYGIQACAMANAWLLYTRDDYESFDLVKTIGAF